ncbi:hypothetical protein GCM10010191_71540 [Actinomadura vinacea]|uniref:Uncharacterized protein n=1 Tax=Actinomadura vinacea TaxID=115336 RepID=A0ABP5X7I9_9ACTN
MSGVVKPVFRYAWSDDGQERHLALGRDDDGWWFESLPGGRTALVDGAAHLAAFARWLLEPRPDGRYEKGFPLVRGAPAGAVTERAGDGSAVPRETALDVDVYLCRDEPDGPERLLAFPSASIVGTRTSYPAAPELVASPLDRPRLRSAAGALLEATQAPLCVIPAAPAASRPGREKSPRTGQAGPGAWNG